jgi:hypothetical protein
VVVSEQLPVSRNWSLSAIVSTAGLTVSLSNAFLTLPPMHFSNNLFLENEGNALILYCPLRLQILVSCLGAGMEVDLKYVASGEMLLSNCTFLGNYGIPRAFAVLDQQFCVKTFFLCWCVRWGVFYERHVWH